MNGHPRVVGGRQESEPGTLVATKGAPDRLARRIREVRLLARRIQAEVRVEVGARKVRVDEDDGLAELRKVDGQAGPATMLLPTPPTLRPPPR